MIVETHITVIVTCTAHVLSAFENYVRSGMAEPVAENLGRGKRAMGIVPGSKTVASDS
jgi:hypothetical protein